MVRHIEGLQPKGRGHALVDREDTRDLRIELNKIRPAERVPAYVAVGSVSGTGGRAKRIRRTPRCDLSKRCRVQESTIRLAGSLNVTVWFR